MHLMEENEDKECYRWFKHGSSASTSYQDWIWSTSPISSLSTKVEGTEDKKWSVRFNSFRVDCYKVQNLEDTNRLFFQSSSWPANEWSGGTTPEQVLCEGRTIALREPIMMSGLVCWWQPRATNYAGFSLRSWRTSVPTWVRCGSPSLRGHTFKPTPAWCRSCVPWWHHLWNDIILWHYMYKMVSVDQFCWCTWW
jgi:hypothetical protein